MKKNLILITVYSLILISCSKYKIIENQLNLNNNLLIPKIHVSKDVLAFNAQLSIKHQSPSDFFSLLPSFSINSDKPFNPGGEIIIELPLLKEISNLHNDLINQFALCYFDFSSGTWKKIETQFDSTSNILRGKIPSLKKENLDSSLSKILITLSFPTKEGLITDLYQQNRLVESAKGNIKDFITEKSPGKNCVIIHGVSSNPLNMKELYKTIYNLNQYNNIIFYQYASGDSITNNAEWLAKNITSNPDVKFDIIAHSMGGLVARYAVEQLGLDKNADKLIMIGTPNNGGNFTEFTSALFPKTSETLVESFPGIHDLITGSKFYQINKDFNKEKIKTRYYVIAGDIGGGHLVKSDIWVSVISATFLYIENEFVLEKDLTRGNEIVTISGWKYYHENLDKSGNNLLYEHSNLHLLSSSNGVAEQLSEWIK